MDDLVVYGAYGYSGELIARRAVELGLPVRLAGRDAGRLAPLAAELGVAGIACALDDASALRSLLDDATAVLHCAGPFHRTWRPMADACLATRTHYLDITGEAEVYLALMERGRAAAEAGLMLLPGCGFDVVPSDCLAAHLHRRLPTATRLTLAFESSSGPARGTATTAAEHLHEGGLVRRGGKLVRVPMADVIREVDFGDGPRTAVRIPWGDVVTAFASTGIPDIEVFMAAPPAVARRMQRMGKLRPLLGLPLVRPLVVRAARRRPAGPSPERLATGVTKVWGEVHDEAGGVAAARLRGPNGYRWTAITAVEIARRVLAGEAQPGYRTPSTAYGPDLVLAGEGVERTDL